MRTLFLAIATLLCLASGQVHAATSAEQIKQATRSFVEQWSRTEAGDDFDVSFEVGHIDSRLSLAECEKPLDAEFAGDPMQTTRPSVLVSCSGKRPWRMYVSLSMEVHGPALVASRALARGERLTQAVVTTEAVQVNASRKGALMNPADVDGMMMRRPVSAGTMITPDLLEAPDAVERGDHVIIIARSRTFAISSRGKALSNASIGEQVRVENLSSARTIKGTVVAPGRVEIPM